MQLMISDDHAGLKAARITVFGGIPWQRCQFHLQQNASAYVPKRALLSEVAADIRAIFNAPDLSAAEAYLQKTVHKCEKSASKLARWMETNIPEGLTVFAFPAAHRCLIRTTNGLERISRELRRRTRTVNILPNEASCLHLVSEILMGIEDAWQDSHIYMRMDGDEPTS